MDCQKAMQIAKEMTDDEWSVLRDQLGFADTVISLFLKGLFDRDGELSELGKQVLALIPSGYLPNKAVD